MPLTSYLDEVENVPSQTDTTPPTTASPPPSTRSRGSQFLQGIDEVGVAAAQGNAAAEKYVLDQLDAIAGGAEEVPQYVPPQERERGFFGALWDGLKATPRFVKGMAMGPAQAMANVFETTADIIENPQNTGNREYTQYGSSEVEQAGASFGAMLSAGGTGAMLGAPLGPIGMAVGATIGFGIGAFIQPPEEGNVLDVAKSIGINVGDGLSRYTYKADDPALVNRMRNMLVDIGFEAGTAGSLNAAMWAIKNRRSLDALKRVYKSTKRDFLDAKDRMMGNQQSIIEREAREGSARPASAVEAPKSNTRETVYSAEQADEATSSVPGASSEVASAENVIVTAAADEDEFTVVLKRKVDEKASELEKSTGKPVTLEETVSKLEDDALTTTPRSTEPQQLDLPLQYTDDAIDALPPQTATKVGEHIDKVLPDAGMHNQGTRKAVTEASYEGYRLTTAMGDDPQKGLYEKALSEGKRIASNPKLMSKIFAKHSEGKALTLNETAALQVWSFEQYRNSPSVELMEKVAQGTASDAEVLAFKESFEDAISIFAAPYYVDSQVATETAEKLGFRKYFKDYVNAGGETIEVSPQAKMAAIKNVVELRGGRIKSQQDAEAIIRWALSDDALVKKAKGIDALSGVTPSERVALANRVRQALAAKTSEELQEAMTSIAVRSWGRSLAEGTTSYMTKNMLNGHSTPLSIFLSGAWDVVSETSINYIRVPLALVRERDLFGARREMKRANAYAASLIKNFRAAAKESGEALRSYDPTQTFKEYHIDPTDRTSRMLENASEVPNPQTGGGAMSFIKKGFWHTVSTGERLAYSFDAGLSHLVENARLSAEAAYEAMERFKAGELSKAEVDRWISNPPPEIVAKYSEQARRDANRFAYRGDLEFAMFQKLADFTKGKTATSYAMRILNPFLRPALIGVERTFEYLPGLNLALPSVRESLQAGGSRALQVHARAAAGAIPIVSAMGLSRSGIISGPGNYSATYDDEGKRIPPYHIRIGDSWYPLETVFGNGIVTNFLKIGANLDHMFDKANDENWEAVWQAAALTLAEAFSIDRIGDLGFLMEGIEDISRGKLSLTSMAERTGKAFVQRFLPYQRLARDIMGDGYDSKVVVGGNSPMEYMANLLDQTWKESYAPTKLANNPNYFGESAKRRSTFFYSWDHYTSADPAEEDVSPLKVLRDLDDYATSYANIGAVQVSDPEWPTALQDPITGNSIRLGPSLYNKYQIAVSGYHPETGTKLPGLYGVGNPMDYRETLEAVYKEHAATLSKFYEGEALSIKEFNAMITRINELKYQQHARAKELILRDPEFQDMAEQVARAKAEKEEAIQSLINYGG